MMQTSDFWIFDEDSAVLFLSKISVNVIFLGMTNRAKHPESWKEHIEAHVTQCKSQ